MLTLFPQIFPGPLGISLLGQAREAGLWSLDTLQIRDFSLGRHRQVDGVPAGGGAGMVLRADVLGPVLDQARKRSPEAALIYLSPRGTPLTQKLVHNLSEGLGVTLLAGRFEGVDQRVIDEKDLHEISIGDYVLAGGELAAMVLIEACVRLIPGVIGTSESLVSESFETGLLEYPQYTKPRNWMGRAIPDILLSGDHKKIEEWRHRQSEELTATRRPDLINPTRSSK